MTRSKRSSPPLYFSPTVLFSLTTIFFHFSVEFYLHILEGFLVCYVSKYCLRQCFCSIDDLAEALSKDPWLPFILLKSILYPLIERACQKSANKFNNTPQRD